MVRGEHKWVSKWGAKRLKRLDAQDSSKRESLRDFISGKFKVIMGILQSKEDRTRLYHLCSQVLAVAPSHIG